MSELKIAVVCCNNLNRSMEAHDLLGKKGFQVRSFGCGSHVKLPGRKKISHIYDFDASYEQMYNDLLELDESFYTRNGVLQMLDRNRKIKSHPERFQDCDDIFDVIFTVDRVIFEEVIECLEKKYSHYPAHIINLDVKDSPAKASRGAILIGELATKMSESTDLVHEVYDIIEGVEKSAKCFILHEYLGPQEQA